MKIYFTASTAEFLKYKKNYLAIRNFLVDEKHILTRDWIDRALKRIQAGNHDIPDIGQIYDECMQNINESELVIIEDTVSNFSTGHQITIALQRQKPTLVLWCKPKHRHFKQTFIQGIKDPNLQVAEYTLDNYKDIIRSFINKYSNANLKNRFHLVIDEVERKYLDWAQFNYGKSRTNIIRQAIRDRINSDEKYSEYLIQKN